MAVALVVFDARSETDPLAGVRHSERALRLAQQRQGTPGAPMKKFLVSARNDRGGVSIGEDRLQAILKEFGFDGYSKTSVKEGWEIKQLRAAIEQAIEWERAAGGFVVTTVRGHQVVPTGGKEYGAPPGAGWAASRRVHPSASRNGGQGGEPAGPV
jgi:hypothetical protein